MNAFFGAFAAIQVTVFIWIVSILAATSNLECLPGEVLIMAWGNSGFACVAGRYP